MASDINLLPPELRSGDQRSKKDQTPDILYTNPDKVILPVKKEPEPLVVEQKKVDQESWWQKFRHQAQKSANQQPTLTPRPILEPISPPVFQPKVIEQKVIIADHKKSSEKKSWSLKIFDHKKSKSFSAPKVSTESVKNSPPAKFHQPTNNQAHEGLEVDLASEVVRFDNTAWHKKIIIASSLAGLWLILLIVAYWALVSYQQSNQNLTSDVDAQLAQIKNEIKQADQTGQEIMILSQRLNLIGNLLAGHQYWSKLFTFLENQTLDGVFYDSLAIDPTGKISLGVVAQDYVTAAQQLAIFQAADDDIAEVLFTAATSQLQKTETSQTTVVTFTVELLPEKSFFSK